MITEQVDGPRGPGPIGRPGRRGLGVVGLLAALGGAGSLGGCKSGSPAPAESQVWFEPVEPMGRVTGVVTDFETGAPVAGAEVVAGGEVAMTGSDGTFELTARFGRAMLTVRRRGYVEAQREVAVGGTASQNPIKMIQLAPPVRVGRQGGMVMAQDVALAVAADTFAGDAQVSVTPLARAQVAVVDDYPQFVDENDVFRRVVGRVVVTSDTPPGTPSRLRVPVPEDSTMENLVAIDLTNQNGSEPLKPVSVRGGVAEFVVKASGSFELSVDALSADGKSVGYLVSGDDPAAPVPRRGGEVVREVGEVAAASRSMSLVDPEGSRIELPPGSAVTLQQPGDPDFTAPSSTAQGQPLVLRQQAAAFAAILGGGGGGSITAPPPAEKEISFMYRDPRGFIRKVKVRPPIKAAVPRLIPRVVEHRRLQTQMYIRNRLLPPNSFPRRFLVRSRRAVMGVRGTAFSMMTCEVDGKYADVVEVYEGEAEVEVGGRKHMVGAGQTATFCDGCDSSTRQACQAAVAAAQPVDAGTPIAPPPPDARIAEAAPPPPRPPDPPPPDAAPPDVPVSPITAARCQMPRCFTDEVDRCMLTRACVSETSGNTRVRCFQNGVTSVHLASEAMNGTCTFSGGRTVQVGNATVCGEFRYFVADGAPCYNVLGWTVGENPRRPEFRGTFEMRTGAGNRLFARMENSGLDFTPDMGGTSLMRVSCEGGPTVLVPFGDDCLHYRVISSGGCTTGMCSAPGFPSGADGGASAADGGAR